MFQICQKDKYGFARPAVPWFSAGIGIHLFGDIRP